MTWLRRIAVSTTTRAEFGLLRPLVAGLSSHAEFACSLFVGGTHLTAEHGHTIDEIQAAGFAIARRLDYLGEAAQQQSPAPTAAEAAQATALMGRALVEEETDLLVLLGDRYETLAGAVAALCVGVPVLHLHGGELTLGALDDAARHAITKLSHLHGVATEEYRRRVLQLGEEDWRVRTVGALGLASMRDLADVSDAEIEHEFGLPPDDSFVLVAVHPETLAAAPPAQLATALRSGLADYKGIILITGCNTDPGHHELRAALEQWVATDPRCVFRQSLGQKLLFAVMRRAEALLGNTSCGILEAPSFGLPVVNIGLRQEGRIRAANVLDVAADGAAVASALERARSSGFRESARSAANPYGDGQAVERLLSFLEEAAQRPRAEVRKKRFTDGR